jgi:hypothetical protein
LLKLPAEICPCFVGGVIHCESKIDLLKVMRWKEADLIGTFGESMFIGVVSILTLYTIPAKARAV